MKCIHLTIVANWVYNPSCLIPCSSCEDIRDYSSVDDIYLHMLQSTHSNLIYFIMLAKMNATISMEVFKSSSKASNFSGPLQLLRAAWRCLSSGGSTCQELPPSTQCSGPATHLHAPAPQQAHRRA
uniref:Uncharacterized protein n=1 Tax=Anser brachyrhynchus TaxID=132585 RepID=A0A8B9CBZ2_9AVES